MKPKDSHCSHCGAAFQAVDAYPRKCGPCGAMTWSNPIPVAVLLQPMDVDGRQGLVVIRRGIEPQKGKLALVGGFVDHDEPWEVAAARELREETGLEVSADFEPFWFTSTEPRANRVLLFAIGRPLDGASLAQFEATNETTERGVVFGPDGLEDVFAFPLHAEAARRYFAHHDQAGPNDYRPV